MATSKTIRYHKADLDFEKMLLCVSYDPCFWSKEVMEGLERWAERRRKQGMDEWVDKYGAFVVMGFFGFCIGLGKEMTSLTW